MVSEGISAIESRNKGELRSWNCVQAFNAASFTVTFINSSIATRLEREKKERGVHSMVREVTDMSSSLGKQSSV